MGSEKHPDTYCPEAYDSHEHQWLKVESTWSVKGGGPSCPEIKLVCAHCEATKTIKVN